MSDSESNIKQVIVVRTDLNMRKGKMAAQVAHASMKFLIENSEIGNSSNELKVTLSNSETEWIHGTFTKIVVGVDSEDALRDLMLKGKLNDIEVHAIVDSGKTEFNGVPTLTCAAFGPENSDLLDKITGGLKLL